MFSNMADRETDGNTEEDWRIFDLLCKDQTFERERESRLCPRDAEIEEETTALREELAAAEYNRDRLQNEVTEMRGTLCAREARLTELQLELDRLREQSCRQGAALSSTRQRLQDAEARERALQVRSEMTQQTLQRELRQLEDRVRCLEKRNRCLENQLAEEERCRDCTRLQHEDFVRRLALALDVDERCDTITTDALLLKASEVVQELARIKCKYNSTADALATCEADGRALRDGLQRAAVEREGLVRQGGCRELEAARLRESLDAKNHELQAARERLSDGEAHAESLRGELQNAEERLSRLQVEHQSLLQSLWQGLGGRGEWQECAIKDRVREVMCHNHDLAMQADSFREKLSAECARVCDLQENAACRERAHEARVTQMQGEIDLLRRDHVTLHSYLQRLSISLALPLAAHVEEDAPCLAEQLLTRAEHLVRIEAERHCCEKILCCDYPCNAPRLRRERSCHDMPLKETSVVHGLQRRVRVLKEQLQRKELHLELLRRKLQLQEEGARNRHILQSERDDAFVRAKRSTRHAEKATAQLTEANNQIRILTQQLAEAADYKICSLERARKIEELQQRLQECETLKMKQARQHSASKDHSRQNEQCLREEAVRLRASLSDSAHALSLLQSFRGSVARLLSAPTSLGDSELIARLQRLVTSREVHHHVPTRRLEDTPLPPRACLRPLSPPRSPLGRSTRSPDRCFRYEDHCYEYDDYKDC